MIAKVDEESEEIRPPMSKKKSKKGKSFGELESRGQ